MLFSIYNGLNHQVTKYRTLIFSCILAITCVSVQQVAAAANLTPAASGNKVLLSSGQTFIPDGISIYGGLEARNYNKHTANIYAQIKAAATYWHANTIRLQVAESNMFANLNPGEAYNSNFLSAINQEVKYAHSFGMSVVINDQTEFTNNTPNPTAETAKFWNVIASRYKNSPYVIFDIFNEPRLTSSYGVNRFATDLPLNKVVDIKILSHRPRLSPMSPAAIWSIWRNGGTLFGSSYIGMQSLVDQIRASGANNIVWVEGSYGARRLPPGRYLLQGSNIVYSIHHPDLNRPSSWNSIASLASIRPVVEGEWAQYQSTWAECYTRAFTNAPKYINFLRQHQIGIIAWSLQANSLVKGNGRFQQPNNLNHASDPTTAAALQSPSHLMPNYSCNTEHGEGVGNLLQTYFAKNSINYHF
jgi:hypothetical protein